MRLQDHPTFRQIQADVDAANAQEESQRRDAHAEAQRIRQEQGRFLQHEYQERVKEYEQQRLQFHHVVGAVFAAAQAYSRVAGQYPSTFPEMIFTSIHLPTLGPSAYNLSPGFTTTYASVAGWFSNKGSSWPKA